MRFSCLLRASVVGAIFVTPTMADEIAQAQEQALQVLRQQTHGAGSAAAPASDDAARQRGDREARLKAEAAEKMAERELRQAEKRQQFDAFIKERERARQEQRALDEQVVREAGQPMPVTGMAGTVPSTEQTAVAQLDDAHARALEILRSATPSPSGPPVTEAEIAPAVTAQPGAVSPAGTARTVESSNEPTIEERQRRIREIEERIKAGGGNVDASSSPAPSGPSPAAAPNVSSSGGGATQAAADDYARELQMRAGGMVRQAEPAAQGERAPEAAAPVVAPAPAAPAVAAPSAEPVRPALDSRTREIIQRQDREIGRAPAARRAAGSRNLDPAAEARAREILRQQQEALGAQPGSEPAAAVAAPQTPAIAAPAQPVPQQAPAMAAPAESQPAESDRYSRELEERARQIILERARSQEAAAATPAPAAVAPSAEPAPRQVQVPPPAAAQAAPAAPAAPAEAQQRALEVLNQARTAPPAATGAEQVPAGPKSKRDRLREITELYRADKLTPAEYHQRRAQILAEP